MRDTALLPEDARRDLFTQAAARREISASVVEKDFWVCRVLDAIFTDPELKVRLRLKGGTSLAKAYNLIERFSEDIDLILDWRTVTDEDPVAQRSNTQQDRLNAKLDRAARDYIARNLAPKLEELLTQCTVVPAGVEGGAGHVVLISYPESLGTYYIKPEVRLEIGPLAAWLPAEQAAINSIRGRGFSRQVRQVVNYGPGHKGQTDFLGKSHHPAP